jgi:hypothetical protein
LFVIAIEGAALDPISVVTGGDAVGAVPPVEQPVARIIATTAIALTETFT